MACGSTVVANRELLEKQIYTQYRHTAGLDMDFTLSFMRQITQTPLAPPPIISKSVCDFAYGLKVNQKAGWIPLRISFNASWTVLIL